MALTTLAALKRHIRVTTTTDDTLLGELNDSVSAEIERVTGVRFAAADYREWYTGNLQRRLVLRNRPVQHVTRIAYGAAGAISVRFAGGIRANASVYRDPESTDAGGLRLVSVSSAGVQTATTFSFTTYPSVSTLVTAVNLVSGWTATTVNNWPTADLFPTAGEDALNRTVTFDYPDLDDNTYRIDNVAGTVEFSRFGSGTWPMPDLGSWSAPRRFGFGFKGFLVQYRAGYETIPTDVALVCREMAKEAYYAGEQNTGVKSFSMGPYSVTFNDDQEDKVRKRLAKYCDAGGYIGGAL